MEFSSNTGMCFRTRLRKRNPRVVDRCSETVSPSDAGTNPSPIFSSRHGSRRVARREARPRGPKRLDRTFLLDRNEKERTTMRDDLKPGNTFPDIELPTH